MALKSPTITWQGTHNEIMKLITKTNMSCLHLNIHKSKKIVVTHESKVGITYYSMVLATNERMLNHLIIIRKHNSRILMHDQVHQPLIFYNRNKHVTFDNKQQQVLHIFLLLCIIFFIMITIPKMIYNGPITNDMSFFKLVLMQLL